MSKFVHGPHMQTKRIPTSSFLRMWTLGNSQARIAGNYLNYSLRKQFVSKDKRESLRNEFFLQAAHQLLGTMGYLRGAIMKVGQLLANLPQIMPKEMTEVFEALQFQAPPMHYSLIREVFLDEFGKEPEEIFASFEKNAFAAASLGQVHRARLFSGEQVAVKVQYPNIADTIEADIKNLGLLLQTMRFKKDFHYLHAHVSNARNVFLQEVDYLQEVATMERNRKLFLGSQIVVPQHFAEFTTKKILTMEHLHGEHLQSFLSKAPSQAQRNHFAHHISYAMIHSWFQHKTIYTDLHPGNFIFMDDGRLGFIDFGYCQQFDEQRWRDEIDAEIAMFSGDRDNILRFLTKFSLSSCPEELDQNWVDFYMQQMEWVVAPVTQRGIFDFAQPEHIAKGVNLIKRLIREGSAKSDPFYNWTNRALLGHRSLMYRLGAKFDYSSLYLSEIQEHL